MGRSKQKASGSRFLCSLAVLAVFPGLFGAPFAAADDHYAAQNGQAPSGSHIFWESAASNIQDAVNASSAGDTVWVGAGRYTVPPNATNYIGASVVFINRNITLCSSNGLPGSAVIDGGGASRGVAAYYTSFVLDGFVISNCYATNMGGGILFNADNVATYNGVVQNCIVKDNTVAWGANSGVATDPLRGSAGSRGAGIGAYSFTVSLNLTLSNCTISGNTALPGPLVANKSTGGGIMHGGQGLFVARNCSIENNSADSGGGMYVYFTTLQADNCMVRGNLAKNASGGGYDNGGGMCLNSPGRLAGGVWLRNCLVCNNAAPGIGGGVTYRGAYTPLYFFNTTIASNTATGGGAGIFAKQNTAGTGPGFMACNSIIYSNSPGNYLAGAAYTETNVWFTNCCIIPTNAAGSAVFGPGNITNNPGFADWAGQNFRLAPASPCVNRGFNQDWMTNAVDFDGRTRIRYSTVDIGTYEIIFSGTIFKLY